MSTNTSPDLLLQPTATDQIAPLHTVLANMQQSVQTALIKRANATTVTVANAAARDALVWPNGTTTPSGGESVFRKDLGWEERYFTAYNATSNPGGAVTAGWYPINAFSLRGRATRNIDSAITTGSARTASTLNTIDTGFSRGANWSIVSGGLSVPIAGEYMVRARVQWAANSTGNRFTSFLVNGAEPLGIVDARTNTTTQGTYITQVESLLLNAGDYVQVGLAQTSGATLTANNPASDLTMWFVGHR